MPRFTVAFYNVLPDSTGHDHHVCQRTVEIVEARDEAQAIEKAIAEFEREEDVTDWQLHARTIECSPATGNVADRAAVADTLNRRLADLLQRSKSVEDELRHGLDADSVEQATDLADDQALAELDAVLLKEVADIRHTLLRIERGDYGSCVRCGGPIGDARLEALPTASLCIACAEEDRLV